MKTVIIDYGSGNLRSAAKAFERAATERAPGTAIEVSADPRALAGASHIVLPGVGAFADCMNGLKAVGGMVEALAREVHEKKKPFLGICVGMELLAMRGFEHGTHDGLGWIAGEVHRIEPTDPALKIPHMGWNELNPVRADHPLLAGIARGAHAYFVHSYHFVPADRADVLATTEYGGTLVAVVGRDNIAGTQFHPEKSQAAGLRLIANFLAWRP
ncbi:MAG: imidazole glycerol phosphate synthase subunit HisH [Rhodospirillales bacterium]|nr:imidazole glycerol phosphate synthase subunit HisH [Rhodospirillales bacterium]